jgi:hypothetical protein
MRTLTDKDLQIRDQVVDLLLPLYPNIKMALEEHHLDSIYGSIQQLIADLYDEDKRLEKVYSKKSHDNLSDNDTNSVSNRLLKSLDGNESEIDNDDEESISDRVLNYLANR